MRFPSCHHLPTPLVRIGAPIGPFDLVAGDVRERGLWQLIGERRRLGRPGLEGRTETADRKQYSADEKIRIAQDGPRGEPTIAEL